MSAGKKIMNFFFLLIRQIKNKFFILCEQYKFLDFGKFHINLRKKMITNKDDDDDDDSVL